MITLLFGALAIAIALIALALQRFYSSVPIRELKRLSRRGDQLAGALYRPTAYGASLRVLLWSFVAILMPLGFVLIVPNVPLTAGFAVLAVTLFVAFVWIPSLRLTVPSAQFAAFMARPIAAVLQRLHPVLDKVAKLVNRAREFNTHSRLYEKEDLTDLLGRQKAQVDNRISLADLELAHRALQFSDRQAGDIIQPRKETHLVNADESIGPILLDQLHKSGQPSFLVYKDEKENIVGSLLMRDAVNARAGGRVFDLVRSDLCFVHEEFSLHEVLAAFQKTGHHTAVVINGFEEFVGVITLDRLVRELVGDAAVDASENYEDKASIASYKQRQAAMRNTREEIESAESTEPTSSEATGVVK